MIRFIQSAPAGLTTVYRFAKWIVTVAALLALKSTTPAYLMRRPAPLKILSIAVIASACAQV